MQFPEVLGQINSVTVICWLSKPSRKQLNKMCALFLKATDMEARLKSSSLKKSLLCLLVFGGN